MLSQIYTAVMVWLIFNEVFCIVWTELAFLEEPRNG
jgi:hypothetical protein